MLSNGAGTSSFLLEDRFVYAGGELLPGLPPEREKERLPKQGTAPQKQRGQEVNGGARRFAGFYRSFGGSLREGLSVVA